MFKVVAKDGKARAGILETAHGRVETPVFMPVGTQGSVKAITPHALKEVGAQIILGNTYHLYLRPGHKVIEKLRGLHRFMSWNGPILTDSGGFQVFSLGAMIEHDVRKIPNTHLPVLQGDALQPLRRNLQGVPLRGLTRVTEEGIKFSSHLDGMKHLLTPELSTEIQLSLGSDICLVLDELLSPLHTPEYVEKSLARTRRWELRSKEYFKKYIKRAINPNALLFGILQGVYDKKNREGEARWVTEQGFDGISIGGSFGTSRYWGKGEIDWVAPRSIYETMDWVVPYLPEELPRHALGIGEVQDLFECIERGIDMFDCVAPTRRARNGSLYINPKNGGNLKNKFTLSVAQSKYTQDPKPIDPGCECYACQNFSRAYLRHLYLSKEILYHNLATIHNLNFVLNIVYKIRQAILDRRLSRLKKEWI